MQELNGYNDCPRAVPAGVPQWTSDQRHAWPSWQRSLDFLGAPAIGHIHHSRPSLRATLASLGAT
jgi:hypothetical protein